MTAARPVERVSVGLVACAAGKADTARPARLLYDSPLFRAASGYAARTYDHWRILSARHYLLHPAERIEPYDEALARLRKPDREHWASLVEQALRGGGRYLTEGRLGWDGDPAPELRLGEWIAEGQALGVTRRVDLWFHAGAVYADPIRALLAGRCQELPYDVHLPLAGLGIGQQLAWYKAREPVLTLF